MGTQRQTEQIYLQDKIAITSAADHLTPFSGFSHRSVRPHFYFISHVFLLLSAASVSLHRRVASPLPPIVLPLLVGYHGGIDSLTFVTPTSLMLGPAIARLWRFDLIIVSSVMGVVIALFLAVV